MVFVIVKVRMMIMKIETMKCLMIIDDLENYDDVDIDGNN